MTDGTLVPQFSLSVREVEALFELFKSIIISMIDDWLISKGKTLAFVLPIVESLVNGRTKAMRKTGYGKSPSVLVLLPARELATQVYADFEVYGGDVGIMACSAYGGAPMDPQINGLKSGVGVVIGAPGHEGIRKELLWPELDKLLRNAEAANSVSTPYIAAIAEYCVVMHEYSALDFENKFTNLFRHGSFQLPDIYVTIPK